MTRKAAKGGKIAQKTRFAICPDCGLPTRQGRSCPCQTTKTNLTAIEDRPEPTPNAERTYAICADCSQGWLTTSNPAMCPFCRSPKQPTHHTPNTAPTLHESELNRRSDCRLCGATILWRRERVLVGKQHLIFAKDELRRMGVAEKILSTMQIDGGNTVQNITATHRVIRCTVCGVPATQGRITTYVNVHKREPRRNPPPTPNKPQDRPLTGTNRNTRREDTPGGTR